MIARPDIYGQYESQKSGVRQKSDSTVFKGILLIIILIGSVEFYKISFLHKNITDLFQLAIGLFLFLFIILNAIYWKRRFTVPRFKFGFYFIAIGVCLSLFGAHAFNGQSPILTIWAQRAVYFYFLYAVLHILNMESEQVIKIIFFFGFLYAILYLVQFAAYPRELFNVRMDADRGTIRIFLPGSAYMNFAYYYSLQEILFRNRRKYFFYAGLFLLIILLTGTRNSMFVIGLVTLLALIFSKRVKSRFGLMLLVFMVLCLGAYLFWDMIINLIEMSQEQSKKGEDDVRMRAINYFLNDFYTNNWAYLTGNGEYHFLSRYGQKVAYQMVENGFYTSDIGTIGTYVKFGAFFVFGGIWIVLKALFSKMDTQIMFIRYILIGYLVVITLASVFTAPWTIVCICVFCYIIDKQYQQRALDKRLKYMHSIEKEQEESSLRWHPEDS